MSTDINKILGFLRSPSKSLPALGQVHDQKTGKFIQYDPYRITETMQSEILDYTTNTPRTKDGQTRFLTLLTARQMGKSLTSEYACYTESGLKRFGAAQLLPERAANSHFALLRVGKCVFYQPNQAL